MALFVSQGQTHGVESGYATSAAGLQDNLDPGLRGSERNGEGRLSIQGRPVDVERRLEFAAEHAVLTQIASAAAAAGAR
jgi:hypothetical protein